MEEKIYLYNRNIRILSGGCVGNLTVALEEKDELKLRRLAKNKYGGRKGSLSKVISEALSKLEEDPRRERAVKSLIQKMEEGRHMGKLLYKHRSELYDR